MISLSPVEYRFLSSPLFSSGEELLVLTIQYLVLQNVIEIEPRRTIVNNKDSNPRTRYFFKKGINFESHAPNIGENFILQLLSDQDEFQFYVLRKLIQKTFSKRGIQEFKSKYVRSDVESRNLTGFRTFPNAQARKSMTNIRKKLKDVDQNIDVLLQSELNKLSDILAQLDFNILLLQKATLEKLDLVSNEIRALCQHNLDFPLSGGHYLLEIISRDNTSSFSLNSSTTGWYDAS